MINSNFTKEAKKKLNEMKKDVESMQFSSSNLTKLDTMFEHCAFITSTLYGNIKHAAKAEAALDYIVDLSENDRKCFSDFVKNLTELYDAEKYPLNDYVRAIYRMCCSDSEFDALSFYPFEVNVCATALQFTASCPDDNIYTCGGDYCASGGSAIAFVAVAKENGFDIYKDILFCGRDNNKRNIVLTYIQTELIGIPAIIRHCDTETTYDLLEYGNFYTSAYLNQKDRIDEYMKKQQ